jgi:outer membrane protein assembly factor BamB
VKWTYTTGRTIYSSTALGADGTVYFQTINTNGLYAVKNGVLKWSLDIGGQSSPAIGRDGTIYAGGGPWLSAVKPNGDINWTFTAGNDLYSSPALGRDGTIYVGCYDGRLYAVKRDGTLKWSRSLSGSSANLWSSPAIGPDGTIYLGSASDNRLYAVNPDGTIKWSYLTGGQIWSSPAVGGSGVIYVGSGDGKLHAVNPTDGSQRWTYSTGYTESSPVIGPDGVVYIGSGSTLYAIYTDCGGPAASSWPMFHRDARRTGRIPLSLSDRLMLLLLGN